MSIRTGTKARVQGNMVHSITDVICSYITNSHIAGYSTLAILTVVAQSAPWAHTLPPLPQLGIAQLRSILLELANPSINGKMYQHHQPRFCSPQHANVQNWTHAGLVLNLPSWISFSSSMICRTTRPSWRRSSGADISANQTADMVASSRTRSHSMRNGRIKHLRQLTGNTTILSGGIRRPRSTSPPSVQPLTGWQFLTMIATLKPDFGVDMPLSPIHSLLSTPMYMCVLLGRYMRTITMHKSLHRSANTFV